MSPTLFHTKMFK